MGASGEVPLTGADLRAFREAWGWESKACGRAAGYCGAAWHFWETRAQSIPPDVAAWVASIEPPPVGDFKTYPEWTPRACLRFWMRRRDVRVLELAQFTGRHESTVYRWVIGHTEMPATVIAWIKAGFPPYWEWQPPGIQRRAAKLRETMLTPHRRGHRTITRFLKNGTVLPPHNRKAQAVS